ncbi:hypothetical protein [Roseibium sp. RKSG952]|uniref:hypothetical protein n=1 Tax=Roseibium sp. RKSG952 TaxID=2529384 RepID=UPI0012BBECBA|nr:hypothetical protein [Roseibium sp. RKSG952]MTH99398.1 hypothetical protein [Roseibium sp. RKSG952]
MRHLFDRRMLMIATGLLAAGIGSTSETAMAQPALVHGTVTFAGNEHIPEGRLVFDLREMENRNNLDELADNAPLQSTGKQGEISYSVNLPAALKPSNKLVIVARLERADGWLIARGSARLAPDQPADITLHKVMY